MKHLNVSVIITVRNEEATMHSVLTALLAQTYLPAEVVITDSCSTDRTVQIIQDFAKKHHQFPITVESFPCNRSAGRNRAIELAKNQVIAITDAGCLVRQYWLAELVKSYDSKTNPVVAGYAVGYANSPFQQAVLPYFLVMPDRVNVSTYLPATRSMLITKTRWEEVGRFDEELNTSEDYIFANKLLRNHVPIVFSPLAEVEWRPVTSVKSIAKTFSSFAAADIEGGVLRPNVLALFCRYLLGVVGGIFLFKFFGLKLMFIVVLLCAIVYALWAIKKNARYAPQGWIFLPFLQVLADVCVMGGTLFGLVQTLTQRGQRR